MEKNFHYDALNDFGEVSAAGNFPNVIDLGDATLERMTVDLKLPAGSVTTAAGVTLKVEGSATAAGTYSTIVASGTVSAAMLDAGYGLPLPKTAHKFIRVNVAGTFTGTIQAIVNTYLGK